MRALTLRRPGSLHDIELVDLEKPSPGPGMALVRLACASLNPADYKLLLSGHASWKFPHTPGLDGAGLVEAYGDDCAVKLPINARVAFHTDLRLAGSFAEYALVPAHVLAAIPDTVSMAQAAALPCAGLTAEQALFKRAGLRAGQNVLIQGAAGGVGSLAVQLAKNAGARVLATCSPDNNDYVRSLGADAVIDYSNQNIRDAVHDFCKGFGADIIIDSVSSHSATACLTALAYAGQLVCLSGLPDISKLHAFTTAPSIHELALGAAYSFGSWQNQHDLALDLTKLLKALENKTLQVHIQKRINFQEVSNALDELRARHVRGKIVLDIDTQIE